MYRDLDLQNCLFGLVGFRQNANPKYPLIAASLLETESGLYFQDEHPLLTIENLDQALTNYDSFPYAAYAGATIYALGQKVRAVVDGKVYESLSAGNTGNEPSVSPLSWVEVPLFSQKLEAVVRSAINKIAAAVFQNKKLREATKSLMENVQLFDGNGSLTDKEIKLGRFVGFKLMLEDHRDITTVIRRLGTQFSQANPEFKLYIFHTSQEDPVKIIDLALTKSNSFEWSTINESLKYLSDDYAPGGAFRIGYYEDLLVGQAINRGYDFAVSPQPCNCNNWYGLYSKWSKFMRVEPFSVTPEPDQLPDGDGVGATLWSLESEISQYQKSYGLNLDLSVRCDTTEFLCREKDLFIQPLLKQVAVDLLSEMAYSVRNNVIAKETRDLATFALLNKPDGNPGKVKELDKSIAALDFDTSDLNEACLPCNNSQGPTYTSI
jgi:hypothetical protein